MIIENPEATGLGAITPAQRTRYRGGTASHCVLFINRRCRKRRRSVYRYRRDSNDGFVIAQKYFRDSRPGELLGTPDGNAEFAADLLRDRHDPRSSAYCPRHTTQNVIRQQAQALIERWMPETERYSNVLPILFAARQSRQKILNLDSDNVLAARHRARYALPSHSPASSRSIAAAFAPRRGSPTLTAGLKRQIIFR